ncbi:Lrp/AsnC ligand binding domain-containing protein, partial [Shimia sp.]|uniref:Lrp/AsnC ligand binding domain-containing protein n=1 Tax=Shimia sp. TaxID=1954381 RepID=UPI003565FFA7
LEKSGYIRRYKAVLDLERLGIGHLMVVQVSLAATADNSLATFNRAVREIEEIESCLLIAGSFDYLLTVRTRDITHFRSILDEKINKLPGMYQTNSFAVMEEVKVESSYRASRAAASPAE